MSIIKKKILIIDDNIALQNLLRRFLEYNNYSTELADNGVDARRLLRSFQPDLVILDVNLPDETGFNLCEEISQTNAFCLLLSSITSTEQILEAFAKGADDYVTKPFNLQILQAKIEALFKRQQYSESYSSNQPLEIGNLKIDFSKREVTLDNEVVPLTALEFDILSFLAKNPNRVWERAELIAEIWNRDDYRGDDRKVDIHIGRIRRKIGDSDSRIIKTIWGRGYLFEIEDSDQVE